MPTVFDVEYLARIRAHLLEQAQLFEDPQAYTAGVEDTLAAVREALSGSRPEPAVTILRRMI